LNGTDGVNQAVAGLVGQGLSIYETLRRGLDSVGSPRHDGAPADPPKLPPGTDQEVSPAARMAPSKSVERHEG
jgi:hypothetical protein